MTHRFLNRYRCCTPLCEGSLYGVIVSVRIVNESLKEKVDVSHVNEMLFDYRFLQCFMGNLLKGHVVPIFKPFSFRTFSYFTFLMV